MVETTESNGDNTKKFKEGCAALADRLRMPAESLSAVARWSGLPRDLIRMIGAYAERLLMVPDTISVRHTWCTTSQTWKQTEDIPLISQIEICRRAFAHNMSIYELSDSREGMQRWDTGSRKWHRLASPPPPTDDLVQFSTRLQIPVGPPLVQEDSVFRLQRIEPNTAHYRGPYTRAILTSFVDGDGPVEVCMPPNTTFSGVEISWDGGCFSQTYGRLFLFGVASNRLWMTFGKKALIDGEWSKPVRLSVDTSNPHGKLDVQACFWVNGGIVLVARGWISYGSTHCHNYALFFDIGKRQWANGVALLPTAQVMDAIGDAILLVHTDSITSFIWPKADTDPGWNQTQQRCFSPALLPLPQLSLNFYPWPSPLITL